MVWPADQSGTMLLVRTDRRLWPDGCVRPAGLMRVEDIVDETNLFYV